MILGLLILKLWIVLMILSLVWRLVGILCVWQLAVKRTLGLIYYALLSVFRVCCVLLNKTNITRGVKIKVVVDVQVFLFHLNNIGLALYREANLRIINNTIEIWTPLKLRNVSNDIRIVNIEFIYSITNNTIITSKIGIIISNSVSLSLLLSNH